MMEIGRISACIDGDYRYNSRVTVNLNPDGSVTVLRKESGACGGMDGPGGVYDAGVFARREIAKPSGSKIARAVKDCFDTTITAYGKPSQNFEWRVYGRLIATGVSATKAQKALDEARSRARI